MVGDVPVDSDLPTQSFEGAHRGECACMLSVCVVVCNLKKKVFLRHMHLPPFSWFLFCTPKLVPSLSHVASFLSRPMPQRCICSYPFGRWPAAGGQIKTRSLQHCVTLLSVKFSPEHFCCSCLTECSTLYFW